MASEKKPTLKHTSAVEWARSLGSTATTHRGAVRYLRTHLKPNPFYKWHWDHVSRKDDKIRRDIEKRLQYSEDPDLLRRWYRDTPGYEPETAKSLWKKYYRNARLERQADEAAAARGIIWTQADAIAEAERLTRLDVERCHAEAKRRNAAMIRKAMGRRSVAVINRTVDEDGHPLILWWRKGDRQRSLSGWDDGHLWTVKVPIRLGSAEEALHWLIPDEADQFTARQGEWFFLGTDYRTASYCDRAMWDGSAVGDEEETDAGTWHETLYQRGEWMQTRHRAEQVVVAWKHGEVAFYSDKGRLRTHKYSARPRLFVKGKVTAPDHRTIEFSDWHEVIGNRAVGAPAAVAVGLD